METTFAVGVIPGEVIGNIASSPFTATTIRRELLVARQKRPRDPVVSAAEVKSDVPVLNK